MRKNLKVLLWGSGIIAVLLGCNKQSDGTSIQIERMDLKMKGSYSTIIEGFDWGPAITKVVIKLNEEVNHADSSDYTVKVERKAEDSSTGLGGEREIINAYVSDENSNPLDTGNYITLEMKVGPEEVLGSPFNYNIKRNLNQWVQWDYVISKNSTGELWNKKDGEKILIADEFRKDSITYKNITLTYAAYEPKSDNKKNPLLIWLHGAGEGGTDPNIVLIGNKVVNLASKEIQDIFHGAYVLAPQSPTMWMDGGNGQYAFDGTSKYTEALMNLIKNYVNKTPHIDRNRIYIGGCSNGGFRQ
ncbi:hypothetical protein [Clostridium thermarum]|uniref:hypothetical protein n=1 Tax=Clostridium thermarum TaxID=1716543 RepID=UPI001121251A|nr:hypothetical protein [Clostridium thermarum]